MLSKQSVFSKDLVLLPVLIGVSLFIVFVSNAIGFMPLALVIGLVVGIILIVLSYYQPRYNLPILLAVGFLIPLLTRVFWLYSVPLGLLNEVLVVIMMVTLTVNGKISGIKSFTGILLLAWFAFLVIEMINPNAASRVAGFLGIRSFIPLLLGYFILYSSINTKRDALTFIKGWFILDLLCGLYGLYQEFFGLPSYDYLYATFDEKIYSLLFTWGRIRKFSFFFSPTEFGIVMAITGMAALSAFFFAKNKAGKIFAAATALVCLWSMLYTGSRTAMVLVPAGLLFLILITFNRKVILLSVFIGVAGAAFMFKPGGSSAVYVMSTAFSGAKDPSMNVRLVNQQIIRSFIHSKPIGFGLGSTGYLGKKYSPYTFVGSFPPDSEYVKIAIETGWLGLLLWCLFLAFSFGYSANVYFRVRDPDWRAFIVLSMVTQLLFVVAFYPQEILGSFVLSLMFIGAIAMTAKIDFINNRKTVTVDEEDR